MPFVFDASVTLAWCFEGEATPFTDHVLERLRGDVALVPAIWPFEVTNALCIGERRRRLDAADIDRVLGILQALPITVNDADLEYTSGTVLGLARAHQLTCYDAAYLELAMRERIPLATQDARLIAVAGQIGTPLVGEFS